MSRAQYSWLKKMVDQVETTEYALKSMNLLLPPNGIVLASNGPVWRMFTATATDVPFTLLRCVRFRV